MELNKNNPIDIKNINLDDCFLHFTDKKNISNIMDVGLIPKIGEHAAGIEITQKVFFSKGGNGALQIINVWIKWLIRKIQWNLYLQDAKDQDYYMKLAMFREDAISGKLYENEEVKKQAFEYMTQFMKNNIYLVLDLNENQDFRYDDFDEAKLIANKHNTREDLNTCYGLLKEDRNINMEDWNMHTISGVTVSPSKIKIVKKEQSYDALDVIKYVYNIMPKENLNISFLNEFINYVENKEVELSVPNR